MTDDGESAVGEDLGDPSITSGPLTQGGCVIHKEVPKSMGDGDLTDFYIATHKHCSVKKGDELDSGPPHASQHGNSCAPRVELGGGRLDDIMMYSDMESSRQDENTLLKQRVDVIESLKKQKPNVKNLKEDEVALLKHRVNGMESLETLSDDPLRVNKFVLSGDHSLKSQQASKTDEGSSHPHAA
uniref:Uncharacterized protein n=1 Tax=Triparma pacifica TaxID=91992 RepID=A0A7S2QV48_9STRA|mmetsp:Transcript_1485/g.2666  ORF Transcript_1485/g.2666 Transcript_1485/m.2666 type:complete len:185 (+) Transcript_1485:323-877(+)